MEIKGVSFRNIVWANESAVEIKGEEGYSFSRTVKDGELCVRILELSPGYRANHWCSKGHVVLVMEGALTTELQDGRKFLTKAGDSFQVGDEDGQHRVSTESGAKVFIVD